MAERKSKILIPFVLLCVMASACQLPHARAPHAEAATSEDGALVSDDTSVPEDVSALSDTREDSDFTDQSQLTDTAADVLTDDATDVTDSGDVAVALDVLDASDVTDATASDGGQDATVALDADAIAPSDAIAPLESGADGGCPAGSFDCGDGLCRRVEGTITTCADATRDGVYVLTVGTVPWCGRCATFGAGARYTMALKASGVAVAGGGAQRFTYDSTLWTNLETWQPTALDRNNVEYKGRGFFVQSFQNIVIEMRTASETRTLSGTVTWGGAETEQTLRAIFMGGPRDMWSTADFTGIVPGSDLQNRCERAGFNQRAPRMDNARVRIGAIANNDLTECDSHDSWVGVGGWLGDAREISVGNVARWNSGGDRNLRSVATVWIR
ncbi:MAG: hypothetical protein Q8Q09_20070 [Deltaproteobacteria bacterium]|nr:hypothetical protein [Deltaproteobacteria bacterium]